MSDRTFHVAVSEASKELTPYERVKYKDLTDAIKIDSIAEEGFVITPDFYVVLDVENEKSRDNPKYKNYVIVDKEGQKYVTGSASFWNAFTDIFDEMSTFSTEFSIKVYRRESKNYTGKYFLTCSLV